MATPTSSSNRSKRKSNKPVTADKGRTNRARVSTAKTTSSETRSSNSGTRVTNASQRTSTGSARVTGTSRRALPAKSSASDLQRLLTASKTKPTRPAPRPVPKSQSRLSLPPGQRGGDLVTQGTRRSRAEAKASNAAKGSTGPNRVGRSDARPALPPGKPGGAMTRASAGGALTRTGGAARTAASAGRGLLGKAAIPLAIAGEVSAMMDRDRRWNDYKERSGMNEKTPAQKGGTRRGAAAGSRTRSDAKPTKPPLSSTGVRTAKGNTVATGSPEYNRFRQQQLDDNKRRNASVRDTTPTRRPSSGGSGTSSPTRSSGSRGGSASSPSTPRTSAPKPRFTGTVDEGRKMWAEKYSSSKYDGQAIQKQAKKLMDEMKKRKEDKSNSSKAGWDGNKNY